MLGQTEIIGKTYSLYAGKSNTDEYYSESFTERAETRGTLFIYEQEKYSWLYTKQY